MSENIKGPALQHVDLGAQATFDAVKRGVAHDGAYGRCQRRMYPVATEEEMRGETSAEGTLDPFSAKRKKTKKSSLLK